MLTQLFSMTPGCVMILVFTKGHTLKVKVKLHIMYPGYDAGYCYEHLSFVHWILMIQCTSHTCSPYHKHVSGKSSNLGLGLTKDQIFNKGHIALCPGRNFFTCNLQLNDYSHNCCSWPSLCHDLDQRSYIWGQSHNCDLALVLFFFLIEIRGATDCLSKYHKQ